MTVNQGDRLGHDRHVVFVWQFWHKALKMTLALVRRSWQSRRFIVLRHISARNLLSGGGFMSLAHLEVRSESTTLPIFQTCHRSGGATGSTRYVWLS